LDFTEEMERAALKFKKAIEDRTELEAIIIP